MNIWDQISVYPSGTWPAFASINNETEKWPKIEMTGLTDEYLGSYKVYIIVADD